MKYDHGDGERNPKRYCFITIVNTVHLQRLTVTDTSASVQTYSYIYPIALLLLYLCEQYCYSSFVVVDCTGCKYTIVLEIITVQLILSDDKNITCN